MALREKGINPKKLIIMIIIMTISTSGTIYLVYDNFIKKKTHVFDGTQNTEIAFIPAAGEETPGMGLAPAAATPPVTPAAATPTDVINYTSSLKYSKLPEIPDIDFQNLFINDPKFLNLSQHGELPVKAGIMGKDNPFMPLEEVAEEEL